MSTGKKVAVGLGGAKAGALIGAKGGAMIGAFGGPVGAVLGAKVGAIGGAITGFAAPFFAKDERQLHEIEKANYAAEYYSNKM